jgi:ketosteroid isomerase-like protein
MRRMLKRFLVLGSVVLALVVLGLGFLDSPIAAQQPAGDDVRKTDAARFEAMRTRDLAALDRLLASDLIYTHGDGRVVDKAAFIADLKTGDFQYQAIQASDVNVRLLGDVAIVTGAAAMSVVNKGVPADIRIRYTNVHVRRNGAWQMIAWHANRLAQ